MTDDDLLLITADHGCDPTAHGTDHTREYIPLLVYGEQIQPVNLGTRTGFSDIGQTVCDLLRVDASSLSGTGFLHEVRTGE